MQDARALRAEIECMKLELSKAVDAAGARTVRESELEQRPLLIGHDQQVGTFRASEAEARKRAIAAGARADEAKAEVAAAGVCAKASRRELCQHAQQIMLLCGSRSSSNSSSSSSCCSSRSFCAEFCRDGRQRHDFD